MPPRFSATLARIVSQASMFAFSMSSLTPPQQSTMLPDEIIAQLSVENQCREQQIQHLAAIYTVRAPLFNYQRTLTAAGASSFTTVPQHPRPGSNRQDFDPTLLLPHLRPPLHNHQCPRMHHRATPPGAHRRSVPRCAQRTPRREDR